MEGDNRSAGGDRRGVGVGNDVDESVGGEDGIVDDARVVSVDETAVETDVEDVVVATIPRAGPRSARGSVCGDGVAGD